jgi:hypothetical protein
VGAGTSGQKQLLHSASQLAHCLEELMELEKEKYAVENYMTGQTNDMNIYYKMINDKCRNISI